MTIKSKTDFVDSAIIRIKAGNGGNGIISFTRTKFQPKGGPSGGHGGKGGNIIIKSTSTLDHLCYFKKNTSFVANNGSNGGINCKTGKNGTNLVINVPIGTICHEIIENTQSNHYNIKDKYKYKYIHDFQTNNQAILIAEGGKGGAGNIAFKSSHNTAPRMQTNGEITQIHSILLELKLLSDYGIIGLPNVGKSTLLSKISAAKPKIDNYQFTTIVPNLGSTIIGLSFERVIVSDMPGLIKGASNNKGLGHQFLKHIERCKSLIHVIDGSKENLYDSYNSITSEILLYDNKYNTNISDKKQIIVISKSDLIDQHKLEEKVNNFINITQINAKSVIVTSSHLNIGINQLIESLKDISIKYNINQ